MLILPVTSLRWASSVGSQHDATRISCWAPAERRQQLSTDTLMPAWRSAANPPAAVSIGETDRQTDGRKPDRYIDPAPYIIAAT